MPHLLDYEGERASFGWSATRKLLDGLHGGMGLNFAHEAGDCHAVGDLADSIAIRWIGKTG